MECSSNTIETAEMARSARARELRPFDTLTELYDALDSLVELPVITIVESVEYAYRGSDINAQKVPLEKVDRNKQPRTLVCHDMKGGYLEDRFLWGSTSHESYVFYHWSVVDTFVYFSHRFITIPPCGWINAAHDHGVKVLGTVITEGSSTNWDTILASQAEVRKFANALVLIAKYHEFEGWLLNIENVVKEEDIDNLIYFVKYLTESIHSEIENSEIIWYDSVTNEGKLHWQNELNDKNRDFFLNCDGIFLNYNWTESRLISSRMLAKELDRDIRDVYVGLDVWGRGCPGGGGFNSAYALDLIRKQNLSVAIFAPGWTHEYFGPNNFRMLEDLFWAQLFPYLYVHVPIYENETFKTSFCRGAGVNYYYNGEEYFMPQAMIDDGRTSGKTAFYNLRMQKPQVSVPVPYLRFTRSMQRILTEDTADAENKINGDDEKDKDDKAKKQVTRTEHIYENKWNVIRVLSNVVTFEKKSPAPDVTTFEFCDRFSYEGGGCLRLITGNDGLYHRLFLVYIESKQDLQATITYMESETGTLRDERYNDPILILGNNNGLKSILPYECIRVSSKWKKCIYLTNIRTVDEIGVLLFPRERECYLGEIVLGKKDRRFDNCDPAYITSRISDYHVQRSAADQTEEPPDDPSPQQH